MRLNGLDFNVEVQGQGPPLLLLHGFTGSVRAWDAVRARLVDSARVICVDLIGHGQTAAPPNVERYTLDWASRDLLALLDQLAIDDVHLVGYSMGGRVALHFALSAPTRLRSLVLESASPGIEDFLERQRRVESDDALADRIVREGIPAFVEEWERQPLLALAPHVPAEVRRQQHEQRLQNNPQGLANSLRGMGAGQQEPLWGRLSVLDKLPLALVVGELDTRYCAVARRMHTLLPRAELHVVSQAGHTAHVDQPDTFVGVVKKLTQAGTRCYIGSERLF